MKTPWHLWLIAIVSLLWNFGGAFDYYMTQTGNQGYLGQMPPDRLEFLDNLPVWFDASWAIGVWFSVLGSVLLLLRSRFAAPAFALSLLGLVLSSIYTYGIAGQGANLATAGAMAVVFTIAIPLVLIALWFYARAMIHRGVLR